jgi:hypothetical protein
MKIVHGDQVEWKRGLQHRGGTFHYRHLLHGKPGTFDNFVLNIGQIEGDFSSPRHRHNFDQFRIQIEGAMNFDRNGKMTASMIGYFPEGAAYGPQSSEGRSVNAGDGIAQIWSAAAKRPRSNPAQCCRSSRRNSLNRILDIKSVVTTGGAAAQ